MFRASAAIRLRIFCLRLDIPNGNTHKYNFTLCFTGVLISP